MLLVLVGIFIFFEVIFHVLPYLRPICTSVHYPNSRYCLRHLAVRRDLLMICWFQCNVGIAKRDLSQVDQAVVDMTFVHGVELVVRVRDHSDVEIVPEGPQAV